MGELCELFPDITRFAVMKHLKVLEEANLLITRKQGRSKLHHLNPVPIHAMAERWLTRYALPVSGALLDLQRQLDHGPRRHTASPGSDA